MKTALLLLLPFIVISCKKKCTYYEPHPHFEGFDSSSLEEVLIKAFKRGTDFKEKVNEQQFLLSGYDKPIYKVNDTAIYWPFQYSLNADLDYLIEVPNAGKVYWLKDMVQQEATIPRKFLSETDPCTTSISSYNLNGETVSKNSFSYYASNSTGIIMKRH